MTTSTNNLQRRSLDTRDNLMRAAEKLIARHGLENVTVRAITEAAGQKNESAMQYHFKNRAGLIKAIQAQRSAMVEAKRKELLDAQIAANPTPTLREICTLMVAPAYLLATEDPGFRQYVRGFGREIALTDLPAMKYISQNSQEGNVEIEKFLRARLGHLDDAMFARRLDSAVKFVGLSMSRHALEKGAYQSKESEVFFCNLIDMLAALLSAEVSVQTRAAMQN